MKKLLFIGGLVGLYFVARNIALQAQADVATETNHSATGEMTETALDSDGSLDRVQQASEESFPASDAPAHH